MNSALSETASLAPQAAYRDRRAGHVQRQSELELADQRFSAARGLIFLLALIQAWLTFAEGFLSPVWLLLPVLIFAGLVIAHQSVVLRLERARRAVAWYDRGLSRLEGKRDGTGVTGARYVDPSHPCSGDLDLFGEESLFQWICGVRTRLGEDTLAHWLSHPASLDDIRARQQAVDELRQQLTFREDLALLDAEVGDHNGFDQNRLKHWVQEPPQPVSRLKRIIAGLLGLAAVITLSWWLSGRGVSPFLFVLVCEVLFFSTQLRELRRIAMEADVAGEGLAILTQVLELLQEQRFETPLLKRLHDALQTEGHPPSWQIARLRNLIQSLNNCLQNQFFAPVGFLLGMPVHVVHRIEMWRERIGPHIPEWLEAVGQMEALSSLAGYAFEHPDDPFPELIPEADGPCFDAVQLGHPLLAPEKCIRNDIRIGPDRRLIMVSGSNMSGKSTLLRTIGINVVLAQCGAPVRARRLKLSPLVVGSAMRVADSLQHGESLFFSVISRIRTVVEMAGQSPPLLFLLDEILQGTNSHDRRVGAEGIIRQLIARGAVGLVTTHDLALTSIVDSFGGQAINIHFEDHLINGRMYFDYRIRPGIVQKSNALELMRMIGLEVGDGSSA